MVRAIREPRADARARRNSQVFASEDGETIASSVVSKDGDGHFQIDLLASGGLVNTSGDLGIDLDTNPGLVLGAGGIKILLDTNPGLELGSGGIKIDLDTTPGLTLAAGGISVTGSAARADSSQNAITLTTVTSPADTPATADALRDDLVANTLAEQATVNGELETAIETLATEFNDLLAKLRTAELLAT